MRLCSAWVVLCMAAAGLGSGCQGHARSATVAPAPGGNKAAARKVVVKELEARGASKESAAGIGAKLCAELAKLKKAELLCADELRSLFQHQEELLTLGTCDQPECLTQLAERLQADFLVQGEVSKVGESWVLTLMLVDGKSGEIKSRQLNKVSDPDPGKLLDEVGALARNLFETL